jgi:branched-subunit amino acid permease
MNNCAYAQVDASRTTAGFGELYAKIDTIVAEEFSTIFTNATRKNNANTEADAKRQYANHMTVIDQLLWHLGSEIAVDGCVSKRIRKNREKKSPSSQAQKSLD